MGNGNQINVPDAIKEKKMLPVEIKNRIINNIFFNCVIFMLMLIITLIINISFHQFAIRDFDCYIDIIRIVCAIISIGVLEIAYRKDSGIIGIYGIEILLFSIAVLFVPHMYISKGIFTFLRTVITIFFAYYIVKSIVTSIRIRNRYIRENMSDIKELVKKEAEKSYIDEESTKTLKQDKIEAEKRKKAREEKWKQKQAKQNGGKKND